MGTVQAGLARVISSPEAILAGNGVIPKGGPDLNEKIAEVIPMKPEDKTTPVPFTEIRFVKNLYPLEKILFPDGSSYRFPTPLLICRDEELAKKIQSVADKYSIVVQ